MKLLFLVGTILIASSSIAAVKAPMAVNCYAQMTCVTDGGCIPPKPPCPKPNGTEKPKDVENIRYAK